MRVHLIKEYYELLEWNCPPGWKFGARWWRGFFYLIILYLAYGMNSSKYCKIENCLLLAFSSIYRINLMMIWYLYATNPLIKFQFMVKYDVLHFIIYNNFSRIIKWGGSTWYHECFEDFFFLFLGGFNGEIYIFF